MKPEILNDIYKHEVFPLFCSELFGADNNLTVKMCEKNLAKLKEIKEALPKSEVPKTMWHFIDDGIAILQRDICEFRTKMAKNYEFDVEKTTKKCIEWIRKWFDENGKGCNAIIGISGGKDSTVTAALCVEALGRDRVIGVMMPNGVQSDIDDSIKVVKHLGIAEKSMTINIGTTVNALSTELRVEMGQGLSEQTTTNMPARVRMTTLYAVAQTMNGRVANTCNLSEDVCGYCTFGGDDMGAFAPLSKLTTDEIMQIGDYLGLPYELVHKTPSDGLQSKTDEDNLGFTYHEINELVRNGKTGEHFDDIMSKYEKNKFKTEIIRIPSFDPGLPNCIE